MEIFKPVTESLKCIKHAIAYCGVVILGLLVSLDVVLIIFGGYYLNDCPLEPFIPKFLLILGCMGMVAKLWSYFLKNLLCVDSLLHTASGVLFIVGSVYIYMNFQPSYEEDQEKYCNKTLYLFSFCYVSIGYGFLLVSMFLLVCMSLVSCIQACL